MAQRGELEARKEAAAMRAELTRLGDTYEQQVGKAGDQWGPIEAGPSILDAGAGARSGPTNASWDAEEGHVASRMAKGSGRRSRTDTTEHACRCCMFFANHVSGVN